MGRREVQRLASDNGILGTHAASRDCDRPCAADHQAPDRSTSNSRRTGCNRDVRGGRAQLRQKAGQQSLDTIDVTDDRVLFGLGCGGGDDLGEDRRQCGLGSRTRWERESVSGNGETAAQSCDNLR